MADQPILSSDQETQEAIALPPPTRSGGQPLLDVLNARRSHRDFRPDPLPLQMLSDLLWAASGVNRPQDEWRRTSPTARNWQEIDIWVTLPEGAYRYEPRGHALVLQVDEDVRADTGTQDFVAAAPLNLVFVADRRRMPDATEEERLRYEATDTAFAAENVYLFCASQGLATVVRGSVDRQALARRLGLSTAERIVLAQSIGFPNA